MPLLLPLVLLEDSLRHVRLTRSPLLIDFKLAIALPSTGSVTDSSDEEDEDEDDEPDATGRTVIVFDVSSAATTSAVTLAFALVWLELSARSDAWLLPDVLDSPDVLDPPEVLDPPYGSLDEPVSWARA
jgi:hypothetical protein